MATARAQHRVTAPYWGHLETLPPERGAEGRGLVGEDTAGGADKKVVYTASCSLVTVPSEKQLATHKSWSRTCIAYRMCQCKFAFLYFIESM